MLLLGAGPAWAGGDGEPSGIALFALQLSTILVAAHLGGALARRVGLPSVIGELSAGLVIGPYALGGVDWPLIGAPFPRPPDSGADPLPGEIHHIASLAAILLLFVSGLETDVGLFMRYSGPGLAVGVAGVVAAYGFGASSALLFGLADNWIAPVAMFLGAVSTATSVGITARLLSERRKMDTPEGVTILAAAVLDDILCFVLLAVVVGISRSQLMDAAFSWREIGLTAARTIGFWVVLATGGLLLGRRVARLMKALGSHETIAMVTFGLSLMLAGISERMGVAAIIGSYTAGLALSRSDLADVIRDRLHGLYTAIVPIFFCSSGMMVDLLSLKGSIAAGLAFTLLAILSKVFGCGLAAFLTGFNALGGLRVGVGMMPRGEVALIVASLGLAQGVLTAELYGMAVLMAILTTLLAPPVLGPLLSERSGLRRGQREGSPGGETVSLDLPRHDVVELLMGRFVEALRQEGYLVQPLPGENLFRARLEDRVMTISREGTRLMVTASAGQSAFVRYLLLEEVLELQDMLDECRQKGSLNAMKDFLIRDAIRIEPID